VDFEQAPPLKGYVSATARDNAEVSWSRNPDRRCWRAGNTGSAKWWCLRSGREESLAVNWLDWPGYGKALGAAYARNHAPRFREELDFRVSREGGEAVIT